MCGIVGAVAQRDVVEVLLEGLRRLEYRGYDSAGVAIINSGRLTRLRSLGKVAALADSIKHHPMPGNTGIAHTRWATHGEPSETNAHPHVSSKKIAVVHNGIIENHRVLREQLQADGYHFESATDTEVIAHLVHREQEHSDSLISAAQRVVPQLEGAYGMVILDQDHPERLIAARSGSPMVIGLGIGENFIASDQLALLPVTRRFIFLDEGDVADVSREQVVIYDASGKIVERKIHESDLQYDAGDKGQFRHYMLKEIYEQPQVVAQTLQDRLGEDHIPDYVFGDNATTLFQQLQHIQIVACGTSYHSAMVARYWLEDIAGTPCNVEIASEFRYRKFCVPANCLFITISQSGETADTLAALRLAKTSGFMGSLTICNIEGSSLVRESDLAFMTRAGTEVGVASSKAFTAQLVGLAMLVGALAKHKSVSLDKQKALVDGLRTLPLKIEQSLELSTPIQDLAEQFADKHNALFLGRGEHYPIAMEGALKLKEISYIHAEAYAAGELKHGPLALIDADMPVVVVAPNNELLEKLKSNIEEVRARGGILYVFADTDSQFVSDETQHVISVPHIDYWLAPIIFTIPLQLLSYYVAVIKGTDVDQPRNLAKSVTVE